MPEEETGTRYNIILSPRENEAIERIQARPEYRELDISKRKAITLALLAYAGLDPMGDLMKAMADLKVALGGGYSSSPAPRALGTDAAAFGGPRGPGRPPKHKPSPEEVRAAQVNICNALGGTVDGEMCMYKKRELTAIGKPAEYEVGVGLDALSQENIDTQYYPDRETWEAADRKFNPK